LSRSFSRVLFSLLSGHFSCALLKGRIPRGLLPSPSQKCRGTFSRPISFQKNFHGRVFLTGPLSSPPTTVSPPPPHQVCGVKTMPRAHVVFPSSTRETCPPSGHKLVPRTPAFTVFFRVPVPFLPSNPLPLQRAPCIPCFLVVRFPKSCPFLRPQVTFTYVSSFPSVRVVPR